MASYQNGAANGTRTRELLVDVGLAQPRPEKWQSQGIRRDAPRKHSEITFHSLRHSTTSFLKNAGVSEAIVRDIIGHESRAVSQHYTVIDEDAKRAAMDKLPDLFDP